MPAVGCRFARPYATERVSVPRAELLLILILLLILVRIPIRMLIRLMLILIHRKRPNRCHVNVLVAGLVVTNAIFELVVSAVMCYPVLPYYDI